MSLDKMTVNKPGADKTNMQWRPFPFFFLRTDVDVSISAYIFYITKHIEKE